MQDIKWMDGFTVSSNHRVPDGDKSLIPSEPIGRKICAHRKVERASDKRELRDQLKEVWEL